MRPSEPLTFGVRSLRFLVAGSLLGALFLLGCSEDDSDGGEPSNDATTGGSSSGSSSATSSGGSSSDGGNGSGTGATSSGTGATSSGSGGEAGCALDACGVCDGDGTSCECTGGFCKEIVDAHNAIRSGVNAGTYYNQPKAEPPLAMVMWDPLIAAKAQEYADSVANWEQGHSSDEFRNYASTDYSGYHGENMAIGGGEYAEPSYFVGKMWGADEAQGCQLQSCGGHYTQIVWRESIHIGCGTKENVPFEADGEIYTGTLTVCQYGPGGNTGGAPY